MQSMAEYKTSIEETDTGYRHSEGNMTKEEAARLAAERERTKGMNVRDAAAAAQDSLDQEIAAKKRFNEIRNMIGAGKHKDMTLEQKKALVAEYKKLKADYSFAKGGIAKQMELFDDGGLMDEGGTTDPVSGNDVPPGSTQEEVRDDIPAQLSEGEFVFPADVVRYVGLENLMRIRQEAKQGLAEMEAMGQMGNSEEAAMPDNLPFDEYDLEVEDDGQGELNFQAGGYVPPSIPNQINPVTGVYQTGTTGITGYQGYQGQPTGFTPYGGATPFFQPVQFTGPQYTTALQTTNLPTFAETVGTKAGQYDELRTYQNDAGQTLQIPFKNGQPIYPIPEGYKPMADQPVTDTQPTVTPTLGQTQVSNVDNSGREDDDGPTPSKDITGISYDPSKVDPTVQSLLESLPGASVGVLKETFIDKPVSTLVESAQKVPISALGMISNITGADGYQAPDMPASTAASITGGVMDSYRGMNGPQFTTISTAGGRVNTDAYEDKRGRDSFTTVDVANIMDINRAVTSRIGDAFKDAKTRQDEITAAEKLAKEEGIPTTFTTKSGQTKPKTVETIMRQVAKKVGDNYKNSDAYKEAEKASQYAAAVTSKDAPSAGAGKDKSMSDQTGYESADIDKATSSYDKDTGMFSDDTYDGGLGIGP